MYLSCKLQIWIRFHLFLATFALRWWRRAWCWRNGWYAHYAHYASFTVARLAQSTIHNALCTVSYCNLLSTILQVGLSHLADCTYHGTKVQKESLKRSPRDFPGNLYNMILNKLASLKATLVRNCAERVMSLCWVKTVDLLTQLKHTLLQLNWRYFLFARSNVRLTVHLNIWVSFPGRTEIPTNIDRTSDRCNTGSWWAIEDPKKRKIIRI